MQERKTMELKKGPVSVFSLLGNSLKVANQAYGAALGLAVLMGVFIVALTIVFTILSKLVHGPLGLAAIKMPYSLVSSFLQLVFLIAVVKILAARFEKTGMTVMESFTSSLLPAIYLLISNFLIFVPLGILAALLAPSLGAAVFASPSSGYLLFIVASVLSLLLLPYGFISCAIALRDAGPIEAIRYAFSLGYRYYLRLLATIITVFLCTFFAALLLGCFVFVLISGTDAASLSGFQQKGTMLLMQVMMGGFGPLAVKLTVIGAVFMAVCFYLYLFGQAIWTSLFLNLDYMDFTTENREIGMTVIPPHSASNAKSEEISYVDLIQASVKAHSDETVAQHLDQVYNAQEHLVQPVNQEEDRMPTILFDDEMAKQLAEAEEKLKRQQMSAEQKKNDDGQNSIKISDKPL